MALAVPSFNTTPHTHPCQRPPPSGENKRTLGRPMFNYFIMNSRMNEFINDLIHLLKKKILSRDLWKINYILYQ